MKVVKGILITLAVLFALFFGLVIASGIKPEISEKLGEILYAGRDQAASTGETAAEGSVSVSDLPPSGIATEEAAPSDAVLKEEQNTNPAHYTDTGSISTVTTIDWNDRYANRAKAIAEEEARAKAAKVSTRYVAPDEKGVKVPDAVTGRAALTEIKEQGETLDDEALKALGNSYDYGNMGQNYQFDALFYPYFHMLGEREQNLYRQIYGNANDLKTTFVPVEDVNASQLLKVFSAVCYDHPELYWLETAYGAKYNKNGIAVRIELKYNEAAKNEAAYWKKFSSDADAIIYAAQGLSSDYEKEKYVHDTLLQKVVYNKNSAINQSAYSALVNGQSVCAGYARAFQYILIKLGIPCYFVGGTAGESHAWNIVKLGNEYYNVDLTWDDTSEEGKYDYFNKSDEDYKKTHVRKGLSVDLPPCNGSTYRIQKNEEGKLQLEPHLRTLADIGFSENDVLKDIWNYYDACYGKALENGKGHFTFQKVIEGDALYEQWKYNNENNLHWSNYMDTALKELGGEYAHITMDVEKLQGQRYLINHAVTIN